MATTDHELLRSTYEEWASEVRVLADERRALILAHNYQVPWIQDVADAVGDSLELSRIAAASHAQVIVFCGVHFMAETAKVLAEDKTVLIPDPGAGCSLSETITADQLRAWKAEHPGAVVVAYVNTSAEVKAESDICCTSANAVQVVESIPGERKILFLPDMFLAAHVERVTGRKLEVWMGECHVHAGIEPADVEARLAEFPAAELLIHPECGCASHALYMASEGLLPADRVQILGTGGMLRRAGVSAAREAIVATENGMLHRLRRENPGIVFMPAREEAVCRYMKQITPQKLLRSLREMVFEVTVTPEVAVRARLPLERMIAIG
ncbi:MAG: quinolinate synthase NadA [Actinomycetota bacterium]